MDKEKELKNMNNTPEENGGAMEGASATGVNGGELVPAEQVGADGTGAEVASGEVIDGIEKRGSRARWRNTS